MVEAKVLVFWGITNIMALVLIGVIFFTLRGNFHNKPWKKILKILLKRLGIVVIVYIILFFVGAIFLKYL